MYLQYALVQFNAHNVHTRTHTCMTCYIYFIIFHQYVYPQNMHQLITIHDVNRMQLMDSYINNVFSIDLTYSTEILNLVYEQPKGVMQQSPRQVQLCLSCCSFSCNIEYQNVIGVLPKQRTLYTSQVSAFVTCHYLIIGISEGIPWWFT